MDVHGDSRGVVTRQLLASVRACAAPIRRLVHRRVAARNARLAACALERLPAGTLRDIGLRWDQIPLLAAHLEDPDPEVSPSAIEDTHVCSAVTDPGRG